MSSIGILGSGVVGQTLAGGLTAAGHTVAIGSRSGGQVENWTGATGTFADVAAGTELVILAVKGEVAEQLVTSISTQLAGKTVLDATNPIASTPPTDGVLSYFTGFDQSLMERLQAAAPEAHFVKAFNSVGAARMVHPSYPEGSPSMFIAGDDEAAKSEAGDIIRALGWEVEDMGSAVAARAIEPLCMLWCIPGLRGGSWTHAFKLLKD